MFHRSPLEYFFHKIIKETPEKINSAYGDAGTAVHEGLKAYIEKGNGEEEFMIAISKVGKKGSHGEPIKFDKFRECFETGKKIVDSLRAEGYELIPEHAIEFKQEFSEVEVKVTGFIDLIAKRGEEVIIYDWKTNTSLPEDGFIGQQKFYTYLYQHVFNIIPTKFIWIMLKNGNRIEHAYGMDTVIEIESEITEFVDYINARKLDVSKYEEREYEHIFNEHFTSCRREVARRHLQTVLEIDIFRNELIFTNLKDLKLCKALDIKFSYQPEGIEFSPKYKSGEWDGKIHMFKVSKDYHKLAIGFYWALQDFINAYNKHFELNYILHFNDKRNRAVQNVEFNTNFADPPFELRYYQKAAVEKALEKKIGVLYLGTSAGKSAIMAEICKQTNKRSLIIINRLELIDQTKEMFEEYLGVPVGAMVEGNLNINNQITIASVQTIDAILKRNDSSTKELITYLFNVNTVLFDECQNVKDKSFYSRILLYAVNVDYCFGLSGTPYREFLDETILMTALVGNIIYSKSTKELEDEGFICPTKTYFIRPLNVNLPPESSDINEMYKVHVLENEVRNKIILDLVEKYRGTKKIMVLTKFRSHGKYFNENIPNSILINSFTPIEERRKLMETYRASNDYVLIASVQIGQAGLNFSDLDIIINASAAKSSITVRQAIGRVKRAYPGKKFGYFIDFFDADSAKLYARSKRRILMLESYGNECKILYNLKDLVIDA